MFLGLPFNIASYAMLTYIIAKKCGMVPKTLIITMGDAHVYKNHIDQVKLQDMRTPFPFPRFIVNDKVVTKPFEELTIEDFDLEGYLYHPSIKAPMAV
jgi:thymidylate synthase